MPNIITYTNTVCLISSESTESNRYLDCNYPLLIDLAPIGIPIGAKSEAAIMVLDSINSSCSISPLFFLLLERTMFARKIPYLCTTNG